MTIKDPYFEREQQKYENPIPSREYILDYLNSAGTPQTFDQIRTTLQIEDKELIIGLKRRLRAMEREGQVIFDRQRCYQIPDNNYVMTGKVLGHRDGYGFLKLEQGGEDWYISAREMKRLIPGDRIEAIAHQSGFKNKYEASVVRIVETRQELIIGRYYLDGGIGIVVPEDPRFCLDIVIHSGQEAGACLNQMVAVEVLQRPTARTQAMGRVVKVIGDYMAPGVEIQVAIHNHGIPHQWPTAVQQQIQDFVSEVPAKAKHNRIDLTQLPLVTIDGEDARDFDDAVYCETKRGGGWRLWVAIADVSSYVTPGSPLDQSALERGTSVYFPNNVIPMLPEVLSNGLCSLNPQVDRLCLVCEMTISARGKLSGYKFYEAVMNSACRFTYTEVAGILDGDPKLRSQYDHLVKPIENLHHLYQQLQQVRHQRGAIEFETVETRFVFNSARKIDHIVPVHRNDAHKLIEECMILANISAAKFITKHKVPGLYRVHDQPDETKLMSFRTFLAELGVETTLPLSPQPADITTELQRLAHRQDSELIQIMLLRSLRQAVYQVENRGHFGLALPQYAHFTSPIRRYPDLLVHRTIKAIIAHQGMSTEGGHLYAFDQATAIAEQCTMAERRADDATREVSDWLKCEYMQDHLGLIYEGVISSVTNFGFFVRINSLYVDGLVHISSLKKEFYHFDAEGQRLIGEHTRIVYRLGLPIKVQVAAVDLEQRKIHLVVASKQSAKAKQRSSATKDGLTVRQQLAAGVIDTPSTQKRKRTSTSQKAPHGRGNKRQITGQSSRRSGGRGHQGRKA